MDFLKDIKKTSNLLMNNGEEKYQDINIDEIKVDPRQPRKKFDNIEDLAESIKLHGVLSPITVFKTDEMDFYRLCFGERRYRAAKQAGLKSIPAVVINTLIDNLFEKQLVENIQRHELNFDEIADTIKYLIDEQKKKKKDIAKSLSKSNSYVTLYYNYAKIDKDIKELLSQKTKDITLIVEINKFLNNAKPDIYTAALDYIKSIDNINRNIIDKLNNLSKNSEPPTITEDDLVRPNIEDYLDGTEEINITETVQQLETDETDDKLIIENTQYNTSSDEYDNKKMPQKELAEQIISGKIYLNTKTSEICKFDGSVIMKLTSNTSKILIQQNKIIKFLKDIDTYIVPYFNE